MSSTSSVLADIEAIIAAAMAEVGVTTSTESPAPWNDEVTPSTTPTIPERNNTVVVSEATSRFSGAIWYDKIQTLPVVLAGVGGIGSYVAFLLGRLNIRFLTIYDDDIVEAANMSGQLYGRSDVSKYKVNAIASFIKEYTELSSIYCYSSRFTEDSAPSKIMICGFDNMQARKTFYNKWKTYVRVLSEEERKECLFIDGRLAAEEYQVLCIKGDDEYSMKRYEEDYLFSDAEADATICSYKQTSFMAHMIASTMVNLFVNFAANLCNPIIDRALPFFTEYNGETMFFKVEA